MNVELLYHTPDSERVIADVSLAFTQQVVANNKALYSDGWCSPEMTAKIALLFGGDE